MAWMFLAAAIVAEVIATTALAKSDGFTRTTPVVIMIFGYIAAFAGLGLALRGIPVSVAYAIWAGAGTALIAAIGVAILGEPFSISRVVGISFVIVGIVAINLNGVH